MQIASTTCTIHHHGDPVYRIAGNFGGQNIRGSTINIQCYIFVVAVSTVGKVASFKYSWSIVVQSPRKPRIFCPTKFTRYMVIVKPHSQVALKEAERWMLLANAHYYMYK